MWNHTAVLKITLSRLAELLHAHKLWAASMPKVILLVFSQTQNLLIYSQGSCNNNFLCRRLSPHVTVTSRSLNSKYCKCTVFASPRFVLNVYISFTGAGVGSGGSGGGCSVISTSTKPLPLTCHFNCGRLDTPCHNTSHCWPPSFTSTGVKKLNITSISWPRSQTFSRH